MKVWKNPLLMFRVYLYLLSLASLYFDLRLNNENRYRFKILGKPLSISKNYHSKVPPEADFGSIYKVGILNDTFEPVFLPEKMHVSGC